MNRSSRRPAFAHLLLKNKLKIAVLGGGSWATALIKILTENKRKVGWYIRKDINIDFIRTNHHNPNYLSSINLRTSRLNISSDINEIVAAADVLFIAIPSAFIASELNKIQVPIDQKIIFSAVKGVVPESMLIVGQHFHEKYDIPYEKIGVITGPCHAEEVAMERLSFLTVACIDISLAKAITSMLKTKYIRTKTSNDIIGTEYASMLKNIYAIAAGIAHSLGYGDNFQSVLMSNAIREMKRFIKDVYKLKRNINNSAYLGDLLVTGYSIFSRNRTFGSMIGKGYSVKAAQMEMQMVAEGYYATKSAKMINQSYPTRIPIIDAVFSILYEGKNAQKIFKKLEKKLD
ncbi:MAG: glycerol-3-phosphate dehydrogenase [Flavobacteriales bacterium MED-G15]|jgi:glycerol-3-phosphate dehydrogenase (NAD(P)+)|nr:MAG: glycerol-3-phosphate dehydrogenase [Flavobacteriales bacterium MED-G15]|tara:strand:- start:1109 stop:2146 length:1038 start_codon:yes stop_codon:yes gene_type:complete